MLPANMQLGSITSHCKSKFSTGYSKIDNIALCTPAILNTPNACNQSVTLLHSYTASLNCLLVVENRQDYFMYVILYTAVLHLPTGYCLGTLQYLLAVAGTTRAVTSNAKMPAHDTAKRKEQVLS